MPSPQGESVSAFSTDGGKKHDSKYTTEPGYKASLHCKECGSFASSVGNGKYECNHPNCGHEFYPSGPKWISPGKDTTRPQCDRCGNHVSKQFARVWRTNDGTIDGCRRCLPRSVRFGEDVRNRDKDEFDDWDPDRYNK